MKTRTKLQQVPTVLLDTVLAVTLKKHLKARSASKNKIYTTGRPVVMQKMISTEEWQKKEALRIAKDASDAAKRSSPKIADNSQSACDYRNAYQLTVLPSGRTRRQEYYFKNKERIRRKQLEKYKSEHPHYKPHKTRSGLIKLQQAIASQE